MDRNREARRTSIVGSNGFNRRKHGTNSLRDSPDEDGGVELHESIKLRDRVKKDRDRERERDRGRDLRERIRDRDLRERSGRSKRRTAERLMSNRDDIGTSDESENDDLNEEHEDATNSTTNTSAVGRLSPTVAGSMSNHHQSHLNHHHNHGEQLHNTCNSTTNSNMISGSHHLQHRQSFPPVSSSSSQKVYRAPPVWKPGDEMIGVSVPRKARSASTKRLHDWASSSTHNNSGGGVAGGDQILRQASSSPVRHAPATSPAPPMSPSSSNASTRKKLKPSGGSSNGPKLKPPKVSLKPGSSNPEELEIEIAEVLYGLMTQSHAPSSRKEDSREVNRSTNDAKSRLSPSISNTTPGNNLIPGPNSTPLTAVAPKRKRPRQVLEYPNYVARSSPKPELDQTPKLEISSLNLEMISGSKAENGFEIGGILVNSQAQPAAEPTKEPESMKLDSDTKPAVVPEVLKESDDLVAKEEVSSPKEKEYPAARTDDFNIVDSASASMATDSVSASEIKDAFMENKNPVESEIENLRQEKFQIDLMAPPPQGRSSPERDTAIDSRAAVLDKKPVSPVLNIELKPIFLKNQENENGKRWRDESLNAAAEGKKGKVAGGEEAESNKDNEKKVRNFDLKLDLENGERDRSGGVNATSTGNKALNKLHKEESLTEKIGQSTNSLPLPVTMASWPGGLPPMGYMAAPLQGVVPVDGTSVTPPPFQKSFAQPRPKRCATHCYIARNIHSLQQFTKMHPFWHAPAGSPTLFGPMPCNLNVIPAAADLNGHVAFKGAHNEQDKGHNIANAPNHAVKDKGSQSFTTTTDSAQRKQQQIHFQQGLPPVPPTNLLAPTFIFPLNHHQAAVAAASVRPSLGKSSSGGSTSGSSNISSTVAASALVPAGGASAPMNLNYPNMAINETQYLAILQNNAYPFTIPAAAAVGAPANYRGTPAQPMPVFNSSFFPSQMIHPSQIQQHHQQPSSPSTQSHQNASVSGSSSFSQKHLQSHQQQRPQSSSGPGNANAQNFPSQKTQQLQNQHVQRPKQFNNEHGSEDSPLDNRGLHASMNIYGQNFAMPVHPQNFALMTPPPAALANASSSGNQNEKKPQQPQQQPPPHSFAMSFGSFNGGIPGPGIDLSSMAQNHAFFQSFPEAARQNLQMMAAAQVAQKKSFGISEDGNNKSGGGDSSAGNDSERKNSSVKSQSQSIAFARSDLGDAPSNVIESSAPRSLNIASGPARSSQAMTNIPNAHIQSQLQQQQMLQLKHHHQQQQQQQTGNVANSRTKTPVSNGSLYTEHLNAKFPNALSGFSQNLVQSNSNSPAQSPPWKNSSTRTTPTSQSQSSFSSSTVKNLPQQQQQQQHNSQIRPQMHTQISFGGTQKRPTNSQGGQAPPSNNHQAPSPPMAIGSPTSSSISKGASGSPRMTNSGSTNNKMSQASALSAQQTQNLQAQKSMSILGNPSSSSGAKTQFQLQQQQQMAKNIQQQAQLYFSNQYSQTQSPHSTSSASGGYFMHQQRRRPDQPPTGPSTSSNGMLLCPPVTLGSSTGTNDPAKAIAAATCNFKGGGLPSQGMMHAAQFSAQLPAGFSYVHPVPTAVQVKPAEQKQPAGQPEMK